MAIMKMDEVQRPGQPEVVLMCGIAGSGKTTYAKDLEARGYARLSVDEEIWHRFGRYGVDYEPDEYEQHTDVAREAVRDARHWCGRHLRAHRSHRTGASRPTVTVRRGGYQT